MENYNTPEIHLLLLKGMMQVVHTLLTQAKIEYFIDGGTLLGAVRHSDIIPHDDDIDIGISHQDYIEKLPSLFPAIENYKLQVGETKFPLSIETDPNNIIVKVYIKDMWYKTSHKLVGTPTLDIFSWLKGKNKIILTNPAQRKQFPNCYYLTSEMYPLKLYKFGQFEFWGANEPMGYLNRYYGEDCIKTAKIEVRDPNPINLLNKSTKVLSFPLGLDPLAQ